LHGRHLNDASKCVAALPSETAVAQLQCRHQRGSNVPDPAEASFVVIGVAQGQKAASAVRSSQIGIGASDSGLNEVKRQ
jgi:hypothetical protein